MITAAVIASLAALCCISGFIAARHDRRLRIERSRYLRRLVRHREEDN